MTRSQWQANEYMKMAKMTQADVDREKSVQDEIDAAANRYKWKERACKWGICAIYLGLGILAAVVIYVKSP